MNKLPRRAIHRHKKLPSVMMHKKQKERGLEPLTKKLDAEVLKAKYLNTSYGRNYQKAIDAGASTLNALRYANLLLRNKPSFGMRRNIFGAIKKGDSNGN